MLHNAGLTRSFFFAVFGLLAGNLAQAQTITPIGTIQGSGVLATSGTYTVEGVVTGVYAGLSPAGFYIQNDAATADGNPATSDALFVVQTTPTVVPGKPRAHPPARCRKLPARPRSTRPCSPAPPSRCWPPAARSLPFLS